MIRFQEYYIVNFIALLYFFILTKETMRMFATVNIVN